MTQWRVTPDGERQWLSADGNWYPSESAALLAGLQIPTAPPPPPVALTVDEKLARNTSGLNANTERIRTYRANGGKLAGPEWDSLVAESNRLKAESAHNRAEYGVAPVPTIYKTAAATPRKRRKVKWGRILILLAVIAGIVIWVNKADSSPPYTVSRISVEHEGTTKVYVEAWVHNLSGSSWTPSCTITVNQNGPGNFFGVAAGATRYEPIDGHQSGSVAATITVTDNDALAVTPSMVQVTSC